MAELRSKYPVYNFQFQLHDVEAPAELNPKSTSCLIFITCTLFTSAFSLTMAQVRSRTSIRGNAINPTPCSQGMPENPMAAIALWSSAPEACPRPSRCSPGRWTVAFPMRVCLLGPVTRRTAPRKMRLMPCPALRAMFRSPWPTPNAFLVAARTAWRRLLVVRLGGTGGLPSTPMPPSNEFQPDEVLRCTGPGSSPASLASCASVDDVDTVDGVDGGGGVARMSLIEVLPSVLSTPLLCKTRRFPTIRFSSCLSVGLAAGSCTKR